MTQEIETIRRPRGPVGTNRWTMNADDMLPGQGRRSFLIPNYIRDVSMKVTRRTILVPRSRETRRFFCILGIPFFEQQSRDVKSKENVYRPSQNLTATQISRDQNLPSFILVSKSQIEKKLYIANIC